MAISRALAVNFAFIYLLLQLFSESIYTSFFYTYFCYTISLIYLLLQLFSGSIYTSFFYTYFCYTISLINFIKLPLHHHNHYFYTYFCNTISRQRRLTSACHVLTHIPEL